MLTSTFYRKSKNAASAQATRAAVSQARSASAKLSTLIDDLERVSTTSNQSKGLELSPRAQQKIESVTSALDEVKVRIAEHLKLTKDIIEYEKTLEIRYLRAQRTIQQVDDAIVDAKLTDVRVRSEADTIRNELSVARKGCAETGSGDDSLTSDTM